MQIKQLRGSFISAVGSRINWFCKYASESSVLYPDKSVLNLRAIICCHCLSGSIGTPCLKRVYDSCLTGLAGIMESPSGYGGKFIECKQVGVEGNTSMNSLKYYPHHLSHLHITLQLWLSFLFPILSQTCEISSFPHLPFTL